MELLEKGVVREPPSNPVFGRIGFFHHGSADISAGIAVYD
jgi:hypothetical protein